MIARRKKDYSAYRSSTLRIVVVAVDREDGNADIEVLVFIVDSGKAIRQLRTCRATVTVWKLTRNQEQHRP